MTDKVQKIKEEIERLKQTNGFLPVDNHEICDAYRARGYQLACNDILQFIDSISEEPASEDLEEEIKNYIQKEYPDGIGFPNVPKIARHFAEWGRNHFEDKSKMVSGDLEKAARYYLLNKHVSPLNDILHQADLKVEMQYHKDIEDAYKVGAEWKKQQMMKNALDGCVTLIVKSDKSSRNLFISTPQLYKELQKYEEGDKLKIIIVKEEQQ